MKPTPVVLAAVFGLEVLGWKAGVAVAVPDAVGEEAFEGDLLGAAASRFIAPFEHIGGGWVWGEACCQVPWVSSKS